MYNKTIWAGLVVCLVCLCVVFSLARWEGGSFFPSCRYSVTAFVVCANFNMKPEGTRGTQGQHRAHHFVFVVVLGAWLGVSSKLSLHLKVKEHSKQVCSKTFCLFKTGFKYMCTAYLRIFIVWEKQTKGYQVVTLIWSESCQHEHKNSKDACHTRGMYCPEL